MFTFHNALISNILYLFDFSQIPFWYYSFHTLAKIERNAPLIIKHFRTAKIAFFRKWNKKKWLFRHLRKKRRFKICKEFCFILIISRLRKTNFSQISMPPVLWRNHAADFAFHPYYYIEHTLCPQMLERKRENHQQNGGTRCVSTAFFVYLRPNCGQRTTT